MIKNGKIDVKIILTDENDKEKVLSLQEEMVFEDESAPLKMLGKKIRAWLTSIAKDGK